MKAYGLQQLDRVFPALGSLLRVWKRMGRNHFDPLWLGVSAQGRKTSHSRSGEGTLGDFHLIAETNHSLVLETFGVVHVDT